ncbi:MAG: hypothetical protein WC856_14055 [Methylococcaceae bacterium]
MKSGQDQGDQIKVTPKGIIISTDRNGHYSGVGMINNQKMGVHD